MFNVRPVWAGCALTLWLSSLAHAQTSPEGQGMQPAQPQTQTSTQKPPEQKPAEQKPSEQKPPDPAFKETVVVSASKTEQKVVDAPATMTVIGPKQLEVAPSSNYAEILRAVPGLNITQLSARDVNVNSRSATSSLATAQLTVVDGRSVYQDFFGFTMWEFVPSNLDEIKQIEAIRGPASAVWGANAMNGVINVITKSPREMLGTTVTFGGGSLDREVDNNGASAGSMFYVRGTYAQAVNERWSYKLSVGASMTDAFARPTGFVPNDRVPPTPYPSYANEGSEQPKFDARVDYDFADPGKKLSFAGGTAGTDGMMHTGIGPFRIHSGANMSYWKVGYTKNAFKLQAFMNTLHGEATNVVSVGPDGTPIGLDFDTTTTDIELGDSRILGGKHVMTYGGNLRFNSFNLTIAPPADTRTEGGAYVQDEFMASEMFRVVAGARLDKFSTIDSAVFSPRVAVVVKPRPDQSVRASYNRAFRAPSMVNNQLSTVVATVLPLGLINPAYGSAVYPLPTTAVGNADLKEESIDAFEVAYTANIRQRATVSAAFFYTQYEDGIYFTTAETWGATTPPPNFPGLGPFPGSAVWAQFITQSGLVFPKTYTYQNLGQVKNKGLELGIDGALTSSASAFVTYAYQADPIPTFDGLTEAQALAEINIPSKHLFSIGLSGTYKRAYGSVSVSHASRAFWQDVLDARFSGYTKPYTSLNLTIGTNWDNGRYGVAFKATNLANSTIQQHIFGDIIKRAMVVEFKLKLQ